MNKTIKDYGLSKRTSVSLWPQLLSERRELFIMLRIWTDRNLIRELLGTRYP